MLVRKVFKKQMKVFAVEMMEDVLLDALKQADSNSRQDPG